MARAGNMARPPDANPRELAVKFKVNKFLGKGSYGSVFLVQRLVDGQQYALKEMDVRSMSHAEREDAVNEIRLLASVAHPNVTSYNEAFLDGNRLCIIMEYASEGDLAKLIKKHQMMKRPIPEDLIWSYFIQVAQGLSALHGAKILHRDIKPGNIMIFEGGVAKIGDLGIAKLLTRTAAAKTQIGTPHYMPPEIWRNRPYGFSSDTWGLGCLLYELAALGVPFEARSMSELRYKVLRGTYPAIPSTFSRDLAQLVRECLDPNPDRRPNMEQLLNSQAVKARMNCLPSENSRAPPATAGSAMLETIKVPRNFAMIKGKLPPAQYATDFAAGLNMAAMAGHMGTIEEGYEGEDTRPKSHMGAGGRNVQIDPEPQHLMAPQVRMAPIQAQRYGAPPPRGPPPPAPAPPPPVHAAPRLPVVPGRGQYLEAPVAPMHGGYGHYQQQPNPRMPVPPHLQQPPPIQTPSEYSQAQGHTPNAWWNQQQGGKVSESHANYGAFYHNGQLTPQSNQSPSGRPPPPWVLQQQLQQAQQQQQQQQGQGRGQYYGGPPPPRPGGDVRLPALHARAAPPALASQAGKPPPWNYGARDKQLAAKRAAAAAAAAAAGGLPPLQQGAPNGSQGQGVARYPPPQWAPQPRRW